MSSSASTSSSHVLPTYTVWLARVFAAACVAAAIYFPLFDKANTDGAGLSIALVVAALLVVAGLFAFGKTSAWLAVGLVTLGSLVGGVATVWTFAMPIVAVVLIVLFALGALRAPSVAVKPAA
jgi:uncharacterized membrane protein (UPF0136 family)